MGRGVGVGTTGVDRQPTKEATVDGKGDWAREVEAEVSETSWVVARPKNCRATAMQGFQDVPDVLDSAQGEHMAGDSDYECRTAVSSSQFVERGG
jgi:hypothetical protein